VQSAGAALPDAEGTRLHTVLSPLFADRTTPDLVSVARGLVEHGDLSTPTEAGRTFGLSKRAYDKVSKDLEGKGLVRRVNGGLLLTEEGGRALLPPSPDGPTVRVAVAEGDVRPQSAMQHYFAEATDSRHDEKHREQLERFTQEAGHDFSVETIEPGAVRPTVLTPEKPTRDGTLVSAHTGAIAPDYVFTAHTSVRTPTPARGKVVTGTHVIVEEESVPVRAPEAAGTAHTDLTEAFEAVRHQYPDALAHTGRWTMWGHDGDTPHTSAYAIENAALGLRGVFVPPAADGGIGAWHWQLPGQSGPVAVTPLRLPTSAAPGAATTPARFATEPAGPLVPALEAAPWSAGLHWRADDEELYVFAGAGAEHPAVVFADGLRPPGGHLVHVAAHVGDEGAPDSAWLTATRKIGWLREQATAAGDAAELLVRYGWRYDIAAPGGVDVDATLDLAAAHPERAEVLYPGGVDGRHIRGAQRLDAGRAVGPYVTNPGFVEPGRPAATEGTGR
jgi:hypothetical protein